MTCQELQNLIDRSLPEERSPTALAEARQHASTCPACTAALTKLLRLEDALTQLSGMQAEDSLTRMVMHQITVVPAIPTCSRRNRGLVGVSLTAAGALILAVVYGWTTNWSDVLAKFFHPSIGQGWALLTVHVDVPRIEIFLATLVGATLFIMGLSCIAAETTDIVSFNFSDMNRVTHPSDSVLRR